MDFSNNAAKWREGIGALVSKNAFLQGRKSAMPVLEKMRVTDPVAVGAVLNVGFGYSEFQELVLYHKKGFFEQLVDFKGTMPLPTAALSPLYGKLVGEIAFALYALVAQISPQAPVFVGLGAGRGVLDFDLIKQLTGPGLEWPEFEAQAAAVKKANFMVSDRTDKSLELLASELAPLMKGPGLKGRVSIRKVNALDFDFGRQPFGVVYATELIDNLPTEPIVSFDNRLYAVKVLAYDPGQKGSPSSDAEMNSVQARLAVPGLVRKESAMAAVSTSKADALRFAPVLVPLEFDEGLARKVASVPEAGRINEEGFGGIYPIHMGIDSLFQNVRKSFQHGVVILVDYPSFDGGHHNWNEAINLFRIYQFGKEDIDFQIDPQQVIGAASRKGIKLQLHEQLDQLFDKWTPALLRNFKTSDVERWAHVQGMSLNGNSPSEMMLHYAVSGIVLKGYDMLAFTF